MASQKWLRSFHVTPLKLTWLAGTSTMNEDVFNYYWKWGDFPASHVSFQGVYFLSWGSKEEAVRMSFSAFSTRTHEPLQEQWLHRMVTRAAPNDWMNFGASSEVKCRGSIQSFTLRGASERTSCHSLTWTCLKWYSRHDVSLSNILHRIMSWGFLLEMREVSLQLLDLTNMHGGFTYFLQQSCQRPNMIVVWQLERNSSTPSFKTHSIQM